MAPRSAASDVEAASRPASRREGGGRIPNAVRPGARDPLVSVAGGGDSDPALPDQQSPAFRSNRGRSCRSVLRWSCSDRQRRSACDVVLKDWHRPAAATTAVTAVFFAYGHVERALDGSVDERVLVAGAVMLGAAAVSAAVRPGQSVARATQFLNLASAVLLMFPAASLVGSLAASLGRPPAAESVTVRRPRLSLAAGGTPGCNR